MKQLPINDTWLLKNGFVKNEPVFENIKLPYWVRNTVCLFFNEGSQPADTFLIGLGFTHSNGIG
jgi:hypothetical protein